jgi:hypothetical protein
VDGKGKAQEDDDGEKGNEELLASDLDLARDLLEVTDDADVYGFTVGDRYRGGNLPYFHHLPDQWRSSDWRTHDDRFFLESVGTPLRRGIRRIIAATVGAERVSRDDWLYALKDEIEDEGRGEQIEGSAERWLQKRALKTVMASSFNMSVLRWPGNVSMMQMKVIKDGKEEERGEEGEEEEEEEDEEEGQDSEEEEGEDSEGESTSSNDDDYEVDSEVEEEGEEEEEGQPRRRLHAVDLQKGLRLLEKRTENGEAAWFPLCGFCFSPFWLY